MTVGRALRGFAPTMHKWKLLVDDVSSLDSKYSLLLRKRSVMGPEKWAKKKSLAGPFASQRVSLPTFVILSPTDFSGSSQSVDLEPGIEN